jgi:hypothetical protein
MVAFIIYTRSSTQQNLRIRALLCATWVNWPNMGKREANSATLLRLRLLKRRLILMIKGRQIGCTGCGMLGP